MTALSESFSLTIICDVFPLMILTFLHFSQVGKPVLDTHIHPKRTYWPNLSLHVLSAFGSTVLPVASLLSVKRVSLSSQLLRNHLGSKLLSTPVGSQLLSSADYALVYYNW